MKKKHRISVIGLGYVGLTTAVALSKIGRVIGFDKSKQRIDQLKKHIDINEEVSSRQLNTAKIHFTTNPKDLRQANFHIISVPTPIDADKRPDLSVLFAATAILGKYLKKKDIVVFESTVYPGATEEKCVPILEKVSGLSCNRDFSVGFSPERINPGDKKHTFWTIPKIVSASNDEALEVIADIFSRVIKAGVYRVSKIRIAEAAKVIENTQRDLNISLMNEIALILHSLGMDSTEVLAALKTKWNYLPFKPGLVGGHCIGINSHYLAFKAEEAGYHPDVILAGRRVNDYVAKFIAETTVKKLIQLGTTVRRARIAVLGLTYKENCPDIRDSKIFDMIKELQAYDTCVLVHDPLADADAAKKEYGIDLLAWKDLYDVDAIILTVAHQHFIEQDKQQFRDLLKNRGLIMDVKGILDPKEFADTGITLWRL